MALPIMTFLIYYTVFCEKFLQTYINRQCLKQAVTPKYAHIKGKYKQYRAKQSHYRPGVAQRVPGSLGSQIS